MKKLILLAAFAFSYFAQAQGIAFTTVNANGEEVAIADNQVFNYSTLAESTAKMLIHVKNNSTESFRFKVRVDDITGNPETGTNMNLQFCFSQLCYFSVIEGNKYPNNPVVLAPGASNDPTDHFWNAYAGVDGAPVSYSFTFLEVDASGNTTQELISFTYNYQPTASVSDFTSLKNMGVTLSSTVVKNQLDVTADDNVTMELYNINGQIVKTATIAQGTQAVDMSSLSAAVYIASFTTQDNRTSKIRIVKN